MSTIFVLCLYYVYYACTKTTMPVLCLYYAFTMPVLYLYYVYYACTCVLCLFATTDTLLQEQDVATVKDGLNISSERFSKSFVVLAPSYIT